ncbi:glycosyltransferase family 9 protein [Mucilaginibacter pallidiroseus]|uniref:Glycosyltransferase family 9 protein n=1 Tax=Mucilaginibacter pallidiroseus TaxID=2599295 RepID=A0A563UBY0_9SPHI|nr:glycosyltransferase family 9 protein [Mucilaginibacter pallidiroseus]TWR28844.1 glycosyltransferase family 9 protein [Mucilaginibacter pallidiroseus]
MKKITYRFSGNISANKLRFVRLVDKLLYIFFKGPQKPEVKEITIVQFAHIGDLILMLPALKKLKVTSNYKVNLVVNSQNFAIASKLKFIDNVMVADAPWFARGKKGSYLKFIKQLRAIKTDLLFDIRGDLRNNLFIKFFTRKKVFAGYNVGGGEALLNEVFDFEHNGHSTDLIKPIFDYLRLPAIRFEDYWDENDVPNTPVTDIVLPDRYMVIHLGAGAQSRRWPVDNFIETLKIVARDIPVYVLGTADDATPAQAVTIASIPNVISCIGKYNILQSIYLVKKSVLFMGLESGFSHIAAMLRKKSVILFSGTSNINVWKPHSFYPGQVTLLKRVVQCDLVTGCGKFVCDDNICMKNIYPFEVSIVVNEILNTSTYNAAQIEKAPPAFT